MQRVSIVKTESLGCSAGKVPLSGEHVADIVISGFSLLLGMMGLVYLILRVWNKGDISKVICICIYGASLILLYASSTLYHSFRSRRLKHIFKILDHIAIYFLIAGTYTPFLLIAMKGVWGWSLFGIIWTCALLGAGLKIVWVNKFIVFSTVMYLILGWIAIVALEPMSRAIHWSGVLWIIMGGLMYSLGTIFFAWRKLPYHHAIWHGFVLGGSAFHYFAICLYVLPM